MKKKIISIALTLALAASTLTSLSVVAYAKEEVVIPEAKAAYDFSYDFDELAEQYPGFEVVENEAAPELVQDEEMGQVLKLNKSVVRSREFARKTDKESGEDAGATGYILSEDADYSQINITNPYQGLEKLKEYEPWEDVATTLYRQCEQPLWTEGITITYWIKTPAGENGYGINSNVVGFTSNRFQTQSDDYAKHLCTVKFDLEYNSLTDELRKLFGPDVERAGVLPGSDFYFELATDELYLGCPMYKDPADTENMGRIYWMNKFFVDGYYRTAEGKVETPYESARYDEWCEAPTFGDTEDDHDPGNSKLRYTWTYSEMWLDASSSFYFENDTENVNKQLNPNHATSYGTKVGMQHNDSFNINSWRCENDKYVDYSEASESGFAVAESPVIHPDEWHMVTCVIQNDWVTYYFDDEEIEMEECYSSTGTKGYAVPVGTGYKPWKRLNKGTGSRYGYGTNKTTTYWCYYGNYCSPTMMEWIIKDCVNTTIGGGNRAGDGYCMYAETDEIQIKNVVFYDVMLDDDQIEFLYENPDYYSKKDTAGLLGDVNLDEVIDAADALAVLKHAAALEILEGQPLENADVNFDEIIDASDALDILKKAAGLITEFVKPEAPTV